jgi:hypothetical protein
MDPPHRCRGETIPAATTAGRQQPRVEAVEGDGPQARQADITEVRLDRPLDESSNHQHGLRGEVAAGVLQPSVEQLAEGRPSICEGSTLGGDDHLIQRALRLPLAGTNRPSCVVLAPRNEIAPDVHPELPRVASLAHVSPHYDLLVTSSRPVASQ